MASLVLAPHRATEPASDPHWTAAVPPAASATLLDDIEQFVRAVAEQLRPDPAEQGRAGPGRPRVLPALALWSGLVVCVLRGHGSQRALWRLLSGAGLWDYPRYPVSDQAVRDRLAEGGTEALVALFRQVSAVLADRLAPYADATLAPFAAEVVALDASTLDQLARTLPALRGLPPGDDRLLPGKLAGRFDLRRQQWQLVRHIADPHQNDKVAARELLAGLPAKSLLLADLQYFAFPWFDDLTDAGYHWVPRYRSKTSYEVLHAYYRDGDTFDGLIWLGQHRADRAKHAVRLVQFRHRGILYRYLTNVLDPAVLPLREIARLYARRWDFEHGYRLDKQALLWPDPRLRTPARMERWTELVAAVHNQLVLARPLAAAARRPWESAARPVTPQQVRRAMGRMIAQVGTPARAPRPRGKSPGRAPGTVVRLAPRQPVSRKPRKARRAARRKVA